MTIGVVLFHAISHPYRSALSSNGSRSHCDADGSLPAQVAAEAAAVVVIANPVAWRKWKPPALGNELLGPAQRHDRDLDGGTCWLSPTRRLVRRRASGAGLCPGRHRSGKCAGRRRPRARSRRSEAVLLSIQVGESGPRPFRASSVPPVHGALELVPSETGRSSSAAQHREDGQTSYHCDGADPHGIGDQISDGASAEALAGFLHVGSGSDAENRCRSHSLRGSARRALL